MSIHQAMKGFFTQGGVLLLKHPIALSGLEPLLESFGQVSRAGDASGHWAIGPWVGIRSSFRSAWKTTPPPLMWCRLWC